MRRTTYASASPNPAQVKAPTQKNSSPPQANPLPLSKPPPKSNSKETAPRFAIPRSKLELKGSVPGMNATTFKPHAETAKSSCPVSKALAGPKITLMILRPGPIQHRCTHKSKNLRA